MMDIPVVVGQFLKSFPLLPRTAIADSLNVARAVKVDSSTSADDVIFLNFETLTRFVASYALVWFFGVAGAIYNFAALAAKGVVIIHGVLSRNQAYDPKLATEMLQHAALALVDLAIAHFYVPFSIVYAFAPMVTKHAISVISTYVMAFDLASIQREQAQQQELQKSGF